jgi:hypothetical protein
MQKCPTFASEPKRVRSCKNEAKNGIGHVISHGQNKSRGNLKPLGTA